MKQMYRAIALILMVAMCSTFATADGHMSKYDKKFVAAEEILQDALSRSQNAIPLQVLKNSKAIVIFPGVMKVGFIFGARYGEGVVLAQDADGNWSPPAYFTVTGGSAGLQAGMESTDLIMCVMNTKGLDAILKQRFTIGADISIAAGPGSLGASGDKDIFWHADILSYTRSRGIFAGVSLNGARIGESRRSNRKIYGSNYLVDDIIIKRDHAVPSGATGLVNALNSATGSN
ncbi:MAG: lipid-binding SYLF domain-containing protein [Candidatus Lindowbacteria bacterium]|nr:lipid-binding SYLF domain-containing protein [Candidatus Lindowbacteria bacterium]